MQFRFKHLTLEQATHFLTFTILPIVVVTFVVLVDLICLSVLGISIFITLPVSFITAFVLAYMSKDTYS